MATTTHETRYLVPDRFSRRIMNPIVAGLARAGLALRGAHELRVRGRRSGEWRTVPVNPLTIDDVTYLVAPRGNTEWVRNLRAAGTCELRLGRRTVASAASEITDSAVAAPLLQAYLRRWKAEVARYFDGLTAESTLDEFAAAAPSYPVFSLTPATSTSGAG
ncbi:MAG TPA: nitroreductase/quinone reductase family protein [Acidimicrobiales bacterium]|nr:nitroreductase/quinone reductase family protein [Acidimicrobiales bacterium]